jgi:molecular chaperone HtpG
MGLRNYFGLAPVPLNTYYELGGIANLSILQPTAGREALSRESIDHVNRLVAMCEAAITEEIAQSDAADRNQSFQQYILTHGRYDLAERVSVRLLPDDGPVALADIAETCKGRKVYYYGGWDNSIIQRFASDQSYLLHLAGGSPKRNVQFYFIRDRLRIEEVPDHPTILKVYTGADLTIDEASILIRVLTVLNDDYLMYNIEAAFAEISHGVPFEVRHADGKIHFYLARNSGPVRPLLECYKTAHDVFMSFVKDFVRSQLYPRFSQFVPSASKEGADALYKLLQKNRELYRYEESDLGDLEALLADYISGAKPWADVLKNARSAAAVQTETVVSGQVGQLEQELSDVVHSTEADGSQVEGNELVPAPPIMRTDTVCDSKVLVTKEKYQQLNNIEVFLGLSDRLFKREGQFFHYPHTTRVIWAAHR